MHGLLASMLLSAVAPALVPSAHATEADAETCLKTKIWEGYKDGWAVRSATRFSRVAFCSAMLACGDTDVANIALVLYDSKGAQVVADPSSDREPVIEYTPKATDTFYIAVHAAKLNSAGIKAGVATSLTYK